MYLYAIFWGATNGAVIVLSGFDCRGRGGEVDWRMASTVDAGGIPIPTSSVLMAASKHIETRCRSENVAFLKCKKDDPNPEKCLDKGHQVTRCVLGL